MKINEIRAQIDNIDDQIVDLFSERLKLCKTIGSLKKKKNLPVFNELREQEILNRISKKVSSNSKYIKQLYNEIFKICKDIQTQ